MSIHPLTTPAPVTAPAPPPTVAAPVTTAPSVTAPSVTAPSVTAPAGAARALAVLRIGAGFLFLWAFLDKTFGLGYSTPSARAWIHGGSPTKGFLASVQVGPLQSTFHDLAGTWPADILFMLGLLGIGVALIAGVAVRPAALAGIVLVAGMWLATFPPARLDATGAVTGSTNPFFDDHALEALVLVVLAMTSAGTTWGLGHAWARLPFVARHRWAR